MPSSTNEVVRERIAAAIRLAKTRSPAKLAEAVIDVIAQDLEDGRMFRHIAQHATITWDAKYQNAVVCFPVNADFFETLEEAVRSAMGETPEDDE